jgi:ankyrin repeat protein
MGTLLQRFGVLFAFLFNGYLLAAAEDSRNTLIEASKKGDVTALLSALKSHADVNAGGPDGSTALQWATHGNHAAAVELLLKAGAKVDTSSSFGVTALSEAAGNGNAQIIEMLVQAGADPNLKSVEGEPAIMTAVKSGRADAVRVLLKHGATVDETEAWKGQTALMWAAAQNYADVAEALIEAGADVNARSAGWPLETKRPANGNIVSVRPRGGLSPLLFAARQGALDAVRVLVHAGAGLNITEPDGTNALVIAIINAHYDLAAFLLQSGADPDIADKYGRTALYAAVDMNSLESSVTRPASKEFDATRPIDIARLALNRGARINAALIEPIPGRGLSDDPDPILTSGATAFIRAAKTADVTAMKLLLDHGASPLLTTEAGTNALMAASGLGWRYGLSRVAETDSVQAIQICLNAGLSINAANEKGETALHGAAMRGANEIVQFLVDHGARLDLTDKEGRTPLSIAEGDEKHGLLAYPKTAALLRKLAQAR